MIIILINIAIVIIFVILAKTIADHVIPIRGIVL